ncbi:50S ribosomal protein L18 [Metamycoplasma arthritidis]|uniref:Large ribosomal subunit protein uL18 n=1 Tax=Metamycoplasma arthritidis (strain 158L3-1) TaxID=243272 RepID=B3PMN1_META1|nr:50S ribosomal protein L18 [Metamycoplasma arthritidis]ACF07283.1 ribosomal protein L18 [Metamycoplasma arthritidis 158L3-1]VEU78805.1 50S ribosomal protein L18 [Metamycoplasma arthritidis]
MLSRNQKRQAKHLKITNKLKKGSAKVPRVCVFKSLHHFYAQAINDEKHITIASFSTKQLAEPKNNIEAAGLVGKEFASKLKAAKIQTIVFDRSGYIYHGKIKAFCEALRAEGIKF